MNGGWILKRSSKEKKLKLINQRLAENLSLKGKDGWFVDANSNVHSTFLDIHGHALTHHLRSYDGNPDKKLLYLKEMEKMDSVLTPLIKDKKTSPYQFFRTFKRASKRTNPKEYMTVGDTSIPLYQASRLLISHIENCQEYHDEGLDDFLKLKKGSMFGVKRNNAAVYEHLNWRAYFDNDSEQSQLEALSKATWNAIPDILFSPKEYFDRIDFQIREGTYLDEAHTYPNGKLDSILSIPTWISMYNNDRKMSNHLKTA